MTSWKSEQMKLLQNLKKDLQMQERTQQRSVRADEAASSRGESQGDHIFERLASQQEGIQYRIGEDWVPATMGQLDAWLFKVAVNIGVGPPRMAIGLPRVPVGVSTWLAVAVMISRVVSAKASLSPATGIAQGHSRWILIACRERLLRDLYLSQRILFSGRPFLVGSFPIYRFRRDGGTTLISSAEPNKLSTPVLFYHFDNIDFARVGGSAANIGLILAEVSETDSRLSRTMLERLEDVRTIAREPKTVVFFNSFDKHLRNCLVQNQYEIADVRPEIPVDAAIARVPTLQGTFSWYCCPERVLVDVVRDDHGISQLLLDCVRNLARVGDELQSTECRAVLGKWWNVWRILKDLAIPLDTYERYRMHAQGRGSLEDAIDRIARSADRIHTPEGKTLQLVAPVICSNLRAIYRAIGQGCPKGDRLMSLMDQARSEGKHDTLFILSEKSQVYALREHFLFTDASLLDAEVPIVHLAKAVTVARTRLLDRCVLPGVWAPWQDSILVAIGASTLTVLMYPYEATLVETRVREHTEECKDLARTSLNKAPYAPVIVLPSEQAQVLAMVQELTEDKSTVGEPPEWLKVHAQSASDALDAEDQITEDEQIVAGLVIRFEDGSDVTVRAHSEMMLVTDDGVESVFAAALSSGDTVAVMRGAAARSIFQSVLAQVNHLVRADDRVIELWRSSVRKLYFGEQYRSVSAIIRALQGRGCRRVGVTIRQWFRGTTLAPQDIEDIGRVLELAGVERASEVAGVVSREIEIIRLFNRRLGRRIREQVRMSITGDLQPAQERIDFEIDEAIEALEYKTIASIESHSGE